MPTVTPLRERGYVLSTAVPIELARLVHASAQRNGRTRSEELRAALAPYFRRLQADARKHDLDPRAA